jgi:uncharacterized membrane protein YhiD involved in acid resistance
MFELFTSREYYEFPSFETAIFSLLLSFTLSTVLAVTYQLTNRGQGYSRNFFQAIILGSMVTSMVLMAIGESIARGLGIIGAIAIIRFRARVDNPRNILFIFTALSIGIATGVYGFRIAIAGTLSFCTIAYLISFTGYGASLVRENSLNIVAELTLNIEQFEQQINNLCDKYYLVRIEKTKKEIRMRYRITVKKEITQQFLTNQLHSIEGINNIRISVGENTDAV